MKMPTQDQINAALRYAGSAVGTIGAVFVLLGALTPDQSAAMIADVHQIIDGLQQVIGGASKLVVLLLPVAVAWLAKIGIKSASNKSQAGAVSRQPNTVVVQMATAADALKAAAVIASIPEVKQVIASPTVADATTSNKVVAAADVKPAAVSSVAP